MHDPCAILYQYETENQRENITNTLASHDWFSIMSVFFIFYHSYHDSQLDSHYCTSYRSVCRMITLVLTSLWETLDEDSSQDYSYQSSRTRDDERYAKTYAHRICSKSPDHNRTSLSRSCNTNDGRTKSWTYGMGRICSPYDCE